MTKVLNVFDIVVVMKDVEVTPLNYVKAGTVATIIDKTCPNYFLIKWNNGCEWIDGKYIDKLQPKMA